MWKIVQTCLFPVWRISCVEHPYNDFRSNLSNIHDVSLIWWTEHFSLTDKTNLVEIQRQFWQQAITAASTARSWCELKPDMKYTMKTSMKWPKIFTRTEDGLYPTLLRAAQLADSHVINDAKESERDVKFLVKIDIQQDKRNTFIASFAFKSSYSEVSRRR